MVVSDVGSGQDHVVSEFEHRIRLCVGSSEPGACFRFCVHLSAPPTPAFSKINIKKIKKKCYFLKKFIYFEREFVQTGEGQRERKTQNRKQAPGSELSAQSPTRGSNSRTERSIPEPKLAT